MIKVVCGGMGVALLTP
nr:hypothetical protein [Vibrio parahaemolyticus]